MTPLEAQAKLDSAIEEYGTRASNLPWCQKQSPLLHTRP